MKLFWCFFNFYHLFSSAWVAVRVVLGMCVSSGSLQERIGNYSISLLLYTCELGTVFSSNTRADFLLNKIRSRATAELLMEAWGDLRKLLWEISKALLSRVWGSSKNQKFAFINSLQCVCFLTGPFTEMCLEWREPFMAGFMGTWSLTSTSLAHPANNSQEALSGSKKEPKRAFINES